MQISSTKINKKNNMSDNGLCKNYG